MREQTKNSYGRRNKAVLGGRNCEEASEKKSQERKRKQAAGSATTFVRERLMWLIMRKLEHLCNVQHVSSGEERRAHNPEVLGSKPRHAISFFFFFFFIVYFHSVLATELLLLVYYVYCVCLVLESN